MSPRRVPVTNRPLSPDHCYNCGSTGACKANRARFRDGLCFQEPHPLTLEVYQQRERYAAIEAMTSVQRVEVLRFFSLSKPDSFDYAVASALETKS